MIIAIVIIALFNGFFAGKVYERWDGYPGRITASILIMLFGIFLVPIAFISDLIDAYKKHGTL